MQGVGAAPCPMAHAAAAHRARLHQRTETGWKGIKNGELLALAAKEFDLFIRSDQSIRYQQNLLRSTIAVLELSTNDLRRIRVAAAMIQSEISTIKPSEYRRIVIP